jgi:hypothetical protein
MSDTLQTDFLFNVGLKYRLLDYTSGDLMIPGDAASPKTDARIETKKKQKQKTKKKTDDAL